MPEVTRHAYWATLDALAKAREIEATKSAEGEAALAAWWAVAEPRWRELNAILDQAEREDWARSACWWDLWRDARKAGKAPGSVDSLGPAPTTPVEAATKRVAATTSRTRGISVVGSV